MNKIFYFLVKDIYKFRWMIVLWLLNIGFFWLYFWGSSKPDYEFLNQPLWVQFYFWLFPLLLFIAAVQTDSPMGTTAFWQTRPMRIGFLLLSKFLFGMVLLLPLMAIWHWLLFSIYGIPHGTALMIVLRKFFAYPLLLCVFFWIGAVTRNMLQAIGLFVVLWFTLLGLFWLTEYFHMRYALIAMSATRNTFIAIVLAGGLYQFLTRKTKYALVGTWLMLVIVALIGIIWPREKFKAEYLNANPARIQPAGIYGDTNTLGFYGSIYVNGKIRIPDMLKGSYFIPTKVLPAFEPENQKLITINNQTYYTPFPAYRLGEYLPEELLPENIHYDDDHQDIAREQTFGLMQTGGFAFRGLKNQQGTFYAKVEGNVYHFEFLGSLLIGKDSYQATSVGKFRVLLPDQFRPNETSLSLLMQGSEVSGNLMFIICDPKRLRATPIVSAPKEVLYGGKFYMNYWAFNTQERFSLADLKGMEILVYRAVTDGKKEFLLEKRNFVMPLPKR